MAKRDYNKRHKEGLTHFISHCEDCDWKSEDYLNGPRLASEHARKHCHLVIAEKGYSVEYNGRGKED